MNRSTPNQSALQEAGDIQRRTKESLQRIQKQLAEADDTGSLTLATLDDQSNHAGKILEETRNLNEHLDKTSKLQNRFAAWSFSVGSRWQARKLARAERKEEQQLEQTEKTSTGPGKVSHRGMSINNDTLFQEIDASVRNEEERKRDELFGVISSEQKSNAKFSTGDVPYGSLLNDDEYRSLRLIQADDEDIDAQLENLSKDVGRLLSVASTMNGEINDQTTRLDSVVHDMEKANEKQRIVNHRALLFTMSRKEKWKARMQRHKFSLA
jgi:hypothetical protein